MLKPQRFIINKKSDYLRGFSDGSTLSDDGLTLTGDGCFFSELFDSGEKQTRWYKLESVYKLPVNCSVKVTFFTAEDRVMVVGGGKYDISELIKANDTAEKKIKLFSENCKSVSHNLSRELLLTELKGRYLFFAVQSVSSGAEFPEIYEMRLGFSPHLLINMLPEIYRDEENSFFERYLLIFQSLFENMDEKIDHAAESYVPDNPDRDFLRRLSDIFGIQTADLWNEEQLRYIIKNAPRLFGLIGTRSVTIELCGLYLGCECEIVEYYDREDNNYPNYKINYKIPEEKLFIDPYVFTLIVKKERLSSAEFDGLQRIIDACKPAHMTANIITPASGVRDGKDTKLGEGTVLFDDGITLN